LFFRNDLFTDVILPAYGRYRCLFEPIDAPIPYFYGPSAGLIVLNVVLYIATLVKLKVKVKPKGYLSKQVRSGM